MEKNFLARSTPDDVSARKGDLPPGDAPGQSESSNPRQEAKAENPENILPMTADTKMVNFQHLSLTIAVRIRLPNGSPF